eukprot:NODE_6900_length_429_cov_48.563158_g5291_i0.p3 GENE.NODE_6900_length_429_cov_48.563158_g5291_i0~~NODE_6900_length_429_cov_48.563158_g5291_i0.p3  ORF type:complete len:95 (+),score=44.76 NODE_6900_length_429_cov_48.563158_g5291_i0:30-287(+)
MGAADARAVGEASRDLCRELGAHATALVAGFGIPEHMLTAPIAHDWIEYNAADNQGEVVSKEECLARPEFSPEPPSYSSFLAQFL